jgi:hypothetical protein
MDIAVMCKQLAADATAFWTVWSAEFLPVYPYIGDACGVAWRNAKARLCWDKSGPRKIPHFMPFNRCLPMGDLPVIAYLAVTDVCTVVAIMLVPVHAADAAIAAFHLASSPSPPPPPLLRVLLALFDLQSAYRVNGRQLRDVWKQGVVWFDMASIDLRVQFGDASACNTFNRSSYYGVHRARRRIAYVNESYPPRHPFLISWMQCRAAAGLQALLGDAMVYFDDVPCVGFDDLLWSADGRAVIVDGVHWRRIDAVLAESMAAFMEMGHTPAPKKTQLPSLRLTCQGALIDVESEQLCIHPDKRESYSAEIEGILLDRPRCPRHRFNSVAHKLIYCAAIMVRIRPWLFFIFRCLHRTQFANSVYVDDPAADSLRRCKLALDNGADHTVPLAWRETIPSVGVGAIAQYADAAGDGANPGFGVWWVEGSNLYLVFGAWSASEVQLPIHVLEFWTNSMGLEAVWSHDHSNQFVVEYTDNTAAEIIGDSQYSKAEHMLRIAAWRAEFMDGTGLCVLPQRVTSEDNVWADWLSRGRSAEVLAEARALGLSPTILSCPPRSRALLASIVATLSAPLPA